MCVGGRGRKGRLTGAGCMPSALPGMDTQSQDGKTSSAYASQETPPSRRRSVAPGPRMTRSLMTVSSPLSSFTFPSSPSSSLPTGKTLYPPIPAHSHQGRGVKRYTQEESGQVGPDRHRPRDPESTYHSVHLAPGINRMTLGRSQN